MPRKAKDILVLTIGEGGIPPEGYAMPGVHSLEAAKAAAESYDGGPNGGWPRHTMVEVLPAFLHCFSCGKAWGRKHERWCASDEDGFCWSWGQGALHTILMRDGRSIFDHYPEVAKKVEATTPAA